MNVRESTRGGYTINLSEDEADALVADLEYLTALGAVNMAHAPALATTELLDELLRVEEEVRIELARIADCN